MCIQMCRKELNWERCWWTRAETFVSHYSVFGLYYFGLCFQYCFLISFSSCVQLFLPFWIYCFGVTHRAEHLVKTEVRTPPLFKCAYMQLKCLHFKSRRTQTPKKFNYLLLWVRGRGIRSRPWLNKANRPTTIIELHAFVAQTIKG